MEIRKYHFAEKLSKNYIIFNMNIDQIKKEIQFTTEEDLLSNLIDMSGCVDEEKGDVWDNFAWIFAQVFFCDLELLLEARLYDSRLMGITCGESESYSINIIEYKDICRVEIERII